MKLLLLICVLALLVGCGQNSAAPSTLSSGARVSALQDEGVRIANAMRADSLAAIDDPVAACARLPLWETNVERQGEIVDELRALGQDVDTLEVAYARVSSEFADVKALCAQLLG